MGYEIKQPELELNLAPMIDIVFLLLIFFIVASTLNTQQVKKEIQLPTTKVVKESNKTKLDILLTADGEIYLGKEKVAWGNIGADLKRHLKENEQEEVTVYADKEVKFQKIVKLMDLGQQLGITNLSFVLHRKESR